MGPSRAAVDAARTGRAYPPAARCRSVEGRALLCTDRGTDIRRHPRLGTRAGLDRERKSRDSARTANVESASRLDSPFLRMIASNSERCRAIMANGAGLQRVSSDVAGACGLTSGMDRPRRIGGAIMAEYVHVESKSPDGAAQRRNWLR